MGGVDDLTRLLTLQSFVSKEKKQAASSEMLDRIHLTAYRASTIVKSEDSSFVQKKLDNAFVIATKQYQNIAQLMVQREKALGENYSQANKHLKTSLRYYILAIKKAASETISALVRGEKEKGLMDSLLFDYGVPAYVKGKLLAKSLMLGGDTDLNRVLFPQDPSRGLALTVKEWQSEPFCAKQGVLLVNSLMLIKILRNKELVAELSNLSVEQMENAEDPKSQRVLKTRMLVVPPYGDQTKILEALSRSSFRGFNLPNTAMDQSRDRLASLCAVPLRAYALSIRMAETTVDFFDRFLPAGTVVQPNEKLGNYAKQMLDAINNGTESQLLEIISLQADDTSPMKEWIERECKIVPGGDLSKKIVSVLGLTKENAEPDEPVQNEVPTVLSIALDAVSPVSGAVEKAGLQAFQREHFAKRAKVGKKRTGQASSVLSRAAKTFLKHISKDHPSLEEPMEAYLRGFFSIDLQQAAVALAEARFDELAELSELGSSEEDDGVSSDEEGT